MQGTPRQLLGIQCQGKAFALERSNPTTPKMQTRETDQKHHTLTQKKKNTSPNRRYWACTTHSCQGFVFVAFVFLEGSCLLVSWQKYKLLKGARFWQDRKSRQAQRRVSQFVHKGNYADAFMFNCPKNAGLVTMVSDWKRGDIASQN